ncbi:hypothetical protein EKN74_23630 [Enterobacter ludwigii]|nr:hypothetical protein EKN74_23630 [Enterobacter ludwigii]
MRPSSQMFPNRRFIDCPVAAMPITSPDFFCKKCWVIYMQIGYVRVSTNDQNTDLQRQALERAGCEQVFEE